MARSKVKMFTPNMMHMTLQLKHNLQSSTVLEVIRYNTYASPLKKICEPYLNLRNDVKIRELWVVSLLSSLSYARKSHGNREPAPATALWTFLLGGWLAGALRVETLT